jgi:ribonuclease R
MFKIGDTISGEISITSYGSGYVSSENITKNIYIPKGNTNKSFNSDTVKVEITNINPIQIEGKVVEILNRFKTEFVGTIQLTKEHAFFIPDNKRIITDFFIPLNKLMGAKNRDKVVVKLTSWQGRNPNGKVIKILGEVGDNDVEIHSILEEYNLPYEFNNKVINESELISEVITESEISKRLDMRDVLTFTIDGETAKDLDDALSVQWVNGNLVVGVHIADVSHYVRPKTLIDDEAYKRGTSIYLVDRVVPMLPEKLSNNLCSLNPNTDKLVYSFIFTLDSNGNIINEKFTKGIINSNFRLTYTEVQKVIEGVGSINSEVDKAILDLHLYGEKLRQNRSKNNSLQFKGSEVKFKLDENGKPTGVYFTEQKEANWLIENYMVLTNMRVCEFITKKGIVSIHRTHDTPDLNKLESLKTFLNFIDYKLDISDIDTIKDNLNQLLLEVKGTPEENIVNNLVVRCMSKANYQTTNIGHYGLGLEFYTHVTSPIRRYNDLIIHRLLNNILAYNNDIKYSPKELETISIHISSREKVAQKVSRESIKYKQCEYLSNKVGVIFDGVVTSVQDYGLFVDIPEKGCEGLVKSSDISNGFWVPNLKQHCFNNQLTNGKIRLGDEVKVIIKSVDLERKEVNMIILDLNEIRK